MAQHSMVSRSTVQHSIAQHSMMSRSTAQHSIAQHDTCSMPHVASKGMCSI